MRTLAKTVRISCFRTLEINQRFAAIWGVLTHERCQNLRMNTKFYGILTSPIPISPHPQICNSLETNILQSEWKPSRLPVTGRERTGLKLLQSPIIRKFSLYDLPDGPLKYPSHKAVFIWTDSELAQWEQAIVKRHLLKKIQGQLFKILTAWAGG